MRSSRSPRRGSAARGGAGRPGRRRRLPIILVLVDCSRHSGDRLDRSKDRVATGGRPLVPPADADAGAVRDAETSVDPRPIPAPARRRCRRSHVGVGPHPRSRSRSTSAASAWRTRRLARSGPTFGPRVDNDVIFTSAAGDGWWCVCFVRAVRTATSEDVTVRRCDGSTRPAGRLSDERSASTDPPPRRRIRTSPLASTSTYRPTSARPTCRAPSRNGDAVVDRRGGNRPCDGPRRGPRRPRQRRHPADSRPRRRPRTRAWSRTTSPGRSRACRRTADGSSSGPGSTTYSPDRRPRWTPRPRRDGCSTSIRARPPGRSVRPRRSRTSRSPVS